MSAYPIFITTNYSNLTFTDTVAVSIAPIVATGGTGTIIYSLSDPLPTGLSYNTSTGYISGTPAGTSATTGYIVSVTDDSLEITTSGFNLTVLELPTLYAALNIPGGGVKKTTATIAVTSFNPVVASGGYGSKTYSLGSSLPSGLSYNTSTGYVSGTPTTATDAAFYTVTITDASPTPQTSSTNFALEVLALPALTTSVPISTRTLIKNAAPTPFKPVVANGGYGTWTYAISGTLPVGMGFNTSTGYMAGTPSAIQASTSYTVTVTDSAGQTSSKFFNIAVIQPTALLSTVRISEKELVRYIPIKPFKPIEGIAGAGGYSYSLITPLPTGMYLNAGTGEITGSPTVTAVENSYIIRVTDTASQTTTNSFRLSVIPLPALTLEDSVASPITLYRLGEFAEFAPLTFGGGYGRISYYLNGRLPRGVSFQPATGKLSGPPIEFWSTSSFTVVVRDEAQQTSSGTFSLRVLAPTTLTNVTTSTTPLVRYTTEANVIPVQAVGGYGSYTYSVTPSLVSGLSFNSITGRVTGTPTATTSQTYTVLITDQSRQRTTASFSLVVTNPVLASTSTVASKSLQQWYSLTSAYRPVTGSGGVSPLVYSISPSLPSGLVLNTATGYISGTPTVSLATTTFTVTVIDSAAQTTSSTSTIYVKGSTVAPSVTVGWITTAGNLFTATELSPVSTAIAAVGSGTTYTIISGELPSGLHLSDTGVIYGTPNAVIK